MQRRAERLNHFSTGLIFFPASLMYYRIQSKRNEILESEIEGDECNSARRPPALRGFWEALPECTAELTSREDRVKFSTRKSYAKCFGGLETPS